MYLIVSNSTDAVSVWKHGAIHKKWGLIEHFLAAFSLCLYKAIYERNLTIYGSTFPNGETICCNAVIFSPIFTLGTCCCIFFKKKNHHFVDMRSGNDLAETTNFTDNFSISFFIFVVTLGGDGLEPSCLDFFTVLVLSSDGRFFRSLAAPPPLLLLLACKEHIQIHFRSLLNTHGWRTTAICINKFIGH